jgi:hypothetical protein
MCKRHGQKAEKTPNETEIERQPKSATPENHENCPQHQDLERAALNEPDGLFIFRWRSDGLESVWQRVWIDLDRYLRLHRCLFEPEKREDSPGERGAKTPGG